VPSLSNRSILYSQQFINAITTGDMETVLDFFKHNPDAWSWREDRDGTPDYSTLHWAVAYRRPEMVALLLKKSARAQMETGAKRDMRPLMLAAYAGDAESVAMLLESGADAAVKDEKGKTALDYANRREEKDPEKKQIVKWLAEAIANPNLGSKPKSKSLLIRIEEASKSFGRGTKRPLEVQIATFKKKKGFKIPRPQR